MTSLPASTATASLPTASPQLADVAVPMPLAGPLTYLVPPELAALARPGCRVRVAVGRRQLTGVVLELHTRLPEGFALRPLMAVLDREPALPADLLALARFTATYYLAPIGEVMRGLLPASLPAWGLEKVWLTDAGALHLPRSEAEAAVLDALRDGSRLSQAELERRLGETVAELPRRLAELVEAGLVAAGRGEHRRGVRFSTAYELAALSPPELAAAVGRSAKAQAVVAALGTLGRPATQEELTAAGGCGPAVLRRLVRGGALRTFTQIERLEMGHHQLRPAASPVHVLRTDQAAAVEAIEQALDRRTSHAFSLLGVTGAGKTEVYLRGAEHALAQGRSVILLVPEIALVPALAGAARARFGSQLAILHSGLAEQERQQEWERIRSQEARVVLGPRSALFAPVVDLGLVVVDEEQDSSYKQDSVPRYHGRDLALVRARDAGAVCLLVSATPSLETRLNTERGRLAPLVLTRRAGQGELPEGVLVDLRQEAGVRRRPGEVVLSARLRAEVEGALAAGEQVILLRNRRGYSPILLCRACGEDLRCESCGLPRTYHRRDAAMVCHYCGSRVPAPRRCMACGEAALEAVGAGTERVEESFRELFPAAGVEVLDRDTVQRPGGPAAVLERFSRGDAQVLIGTQMVSKGHHFPRVTLTAVLTADSYLGFPDFRAVERTYVLLTQLAGRAGRGERPGKVVIQTFHPDHYAIRAALAHDDAAFAREEMRFRRVFHYPPYTRMVQLLARGTHRGRTEQMLAQLAARLADHPNAAAVRLSGPAPAPLERLRNEWRFQLLLRGPSGRALRQMVADVLPAKPAVDLVVDVDPYQLL